ncbi:Subtilase family protein [Salegentibacter holothuriorum]|uniref:Subtilase family protein n=1 Tax=Salegentibacter holothuriorum TaxID=241145 RepID=A0A1T5B1X6_9FLAO|nr:S8 family serine peptidase [Salegentibacter holothuriorum]SKB41099.1 Subtilase family protein [Salegentibacter holothuriorum]
MKKTTIQLGKTLLCVFFFGAVFGSCEKEENLPNNDEMESSELKEPPFKNYMVITESSDLTKSVESALKTSGGEIVSSIPEIGISIVNSKDSNFIQNTMKNRNVTSVVPDYEIAWIPTSENIEANLPEATPSIGSTEPYYFYDYLWGLEAIDAPEAWNAGFTGSGASVFVLDSGIDAEHVELAPNLNTSLSASFIPGEDWNILDSTPFDNHGTHVAGTIAAAQNGLGLIGVAPKAELVAVKVLSEFTGNGPFSSINAGIVYAGANQADVINMSLGATLNKNGKLIDANGVPYKIPGKYIMEIVNAQQRAIDYAAKQGSTIIASAGNDGVNYDGNSAYIKLPGGLNNVITVSATAPEGYDWTADYTNFDIPSSYTTHGKSLVDIAAPGGDFDVALEDMILSTGNNNGLYWSAGTSMAAPHVSGVAALIIAKNGGEMLPKEVAKQIEKTADKVDGNGQSLFFGKGRINAYRAVTE